MAEDDLSDLLGPEPVRLSPSQDQQRRSRSVVLQPGNGRTKLTPDRLLGLCKFVKQMPVAGAACEQNGISTSTLKLWILRSQEGKPGDGFDVIIPPDTEPTRFHQAWFDAMDVGVDLVDQAMTQRAIGYYEPLTYQGRVIYQHDPELIEIFGYECRQTHLMVNGKLVPETIFKQDPDLQMFILKHRKKEMYGSNSTLDVTVHGGVLVIPASAPAEGKQIAWRDTDSYKADAIDVAFEDVTPDPEND